MTDAACPMPNRDLDEQVKKILGSVKRIAVVGMSGNPERPSREVGLYLKEKGYEILPVHPKEKEIEGLKVYPSLKDIPPELKPDLVDIFLSGDKSLPVVEEASRIGAQVAWFQPGAENPQAEEKARGLGLTVMSGVCTKAEHMRLFG